MDRWRDRDEGLTLVETVVALTVFAIVSAALSAVILNTTELSRQSRERVVAAQLASRELETVREEAGRRPLVELAQGVVSSAPQVGGTTFTVRRTTQWITASASDSSCRTNPATADLAHLRVSVEVSWSRMGGRLPARAQTLLTPRVGTLDPATGNLRSRSATATLARRRTMRSWPTGPAVA